MNPRSRRGCTRDDLTALGAGPDDIVRIFRDNARRVYRFDD
ncbi:hypothetical protein [Nocardia vulneris]|nr:hypothetical protein [Nocardia vulneris]